MSLSAFKEPGVYPLFDPQLTDWALHESEIDWEVVPQYKGPVWSKDPNWGGPRDESGYILPKLTLGWQAIDWVGKNLLSDDLDESDKRLPFRLTPEQARFILWFYEIDEAGNLVNSEFTLQRLKGWG